MTGDDRRFPWARMMALGMGVLHLNPREFWAATPREIWAALPRPAAATAPGREAMEDLMNRFPDDRDGQP